MGVTILPHVELRSPGLHRLLLGELPLPRGRDVGSVGIEVGHPVGEVGQQHPLVLVDLAEVVVPVGGVRFLSSLEVRSVSFGDPTPEEVVDTLPAERTTDELGRPLDPAELKRKMRQAEKALEDWLS